MQYIEPGPNEPRCQVLIQTKKEDGTLKQIGHHHFHIHMHTSSIYQRIQDWETKCEFPYEEYLYFRDTTTEEKIPINIMTFFKQNHVYSLGLKMK